MTKTLFPNPATSRCHFKWKIFELLNDAHFNISDLIGRIVSNGSILTPEGMQDLQLDALREGVYIFHIVNNGQIIKSEKLMVVK